MTEETVTHRVAFDIAGVTHYTRVDTMENCKRAMSVNAVLEVPCRLQYVGTFTREAANRIYPAS